MKLSLDDNVLTVRAERVETNSQLLLDRDPHGNVQVAKIETERLLAMAVEAELAKLAEAGKYLFSVSACVRTGWA